MTKMSARVVRFVPPGQDGHALLAQMIAEDPWTPAQVVLDGGLDDHDLAAIRYAGTMTEVVKHPFEDRIALTWTQGMVRVFWGTDLVSRWDETLESAARLFWYRDTRVEVFDLRPATEARVRELFPGRLVVRAGKCLIVG